MLLQQVIVAVTVIPVIKGRRMIQVQKTAPLIIKLLREQVYHFSDDYRWAVYVHKVVYRNEVLLYNVLTKELLLVEDADSDKELLVKKWFLVPELFKEQIVVNQVKSFLSVIPDKTNSINNYTIFTTTDCNARCYYCFEQDVPKIRMNDEIVNQTIRFIKHHLTGKEISIQWFGGEPLYNLKVINRISDELNTNGISFSSSMTSNGYLFTHQIIKKAINNWKLKRVQITLDGTENNYNRIKSYIHKNSNPYERVLNNIEHLLQADICVSIRLNLSLDNFQDIMNLVYHLIERFAQYKKLTIYPHPLFDLMEDEEKRRLIFEKLMIIQKVIDKNHLNTEYAYFGKPRITHCKADNNGNSVVIFPDGNIGLCDHKFAKEYIGHVSNYNINFAIIEKWRKYKEPLKSCATCLLYADCMKLELCDTNNKCYKEFIEIDKHILEQTMINTYQKFIQDETKI